MVAVKAGTSYAFGDVLLSTIEDPIVVTREALATNEYIFWNRISRAMEPHGCFI